MSVSINEVLEISKGHLCGADVPDLTFDHITLNSAELKEGSLFAALPGLHAHGAEYAEGTPAAAILTDKEGHKILHDKGDSRPVIEVEDIRAILGDVSSAIYGHPSSQMQVIGVTGTSGKTTTSYLLEAGLMAEGHKVGLIGTTGTRINGVAVPSKLTTPEAPKLQELFAMMLAEGCTHVVMEVSSHAISLGRIAGTKFAVGGFTNLSQDHLDFHHTMEEYFEAKAAFFRAGSPVRADRVVVMVDDEWGQKMAEIAGPECITVSTKISTATDSADATLGQVSTDAAGYQEFDLLYDDNIRRIKLALPGKFNVSNASLAVTMAIAIGGNIDKFIEGIASVGVPGRMERIDEGQDFLAVVDYAHKPAAVAAVLESVKTQTKGRVGVVLGAGGDRDATKRPLMGGAAVALADYIIITDDNPRSEDPALIRAAVLEGAHNAVGGAMHDPVIEEIADRAEAIIAAVEWAQPGDSIIVAGKGHENGQLVGDINYPFDDREHVRDALRARAERSGS